MALLFTGSSACASSQEKRDSEFDFQSPLESRRTTNVVSLGDGLSTTDPLESVCLSPVDSPLSDCSWDSGVLGSTISTEEEQFLAGLFGSDFPILQDTPTSKYSLTPSATSEQQESTLTLTQLVSQSLGSESCTHTRPKESTNLDRNNNTTSAPLSSKNELLDRNRKNAEAARQNRIKKKKYVESLEKQCDSLKTENVVLKTKCHEYQTRCERLDSEVEYLKSVLANESVLASLIQNIPTVPSVKLTSSFASRKRSSPTKGQSSSLPTKKAKTSQASGGVCLHVCKDQVSFEFCQNCSKQASAQS